MAPYAFPFVGAGDARYFEHAWLMVRLEQAPSPQEADAISQIAPPPFRSLINFSGAYLTAASEYVNAQVIKSYDATAGDADERVGRTAFAADSRMEQFNGAIETWLEAIHEIVPIVVAVRPEDGEAGGTTHSQWHHWSLTAEIFEPLLERFSETLRGPKSHEMPATVLDQLLEAAESSSGGAMLSAEARLWRRPPQQLATAIRSGDADHVRRLLEGVDPEKAEIAVKGAYALLDRFGPPDQAALAAVREALVTTQAGWHEALAAEALAWNDSGDTPALTAVLDAGRWNQSPEEAFLAAAAALPQAHRAPVYRAGALHLQSPTLVNHYLWTRIQTETEIDACEAALTLAEPIAAWAPAVLLNLSSVLYCRREFERGIAALESALGHGALAPPMLLNAALLYAGASRPEQARRYAELSRSSGDAGAPMIEPFLMFQEGRIDEALVALENVKEGGYEGFGEWGDTTLYREMIEDPRFRALFD